MERENRRLKSMSETTKRCQVEMHDGKSCGRELYDGKCCIFHSEKKDKDVELFQNRLDQIFKDESVKIYDFTRFIFPEGIVFLRKFSKPVICEHAIFKGKAQFENAVFEDRADFVGVTFEGDADFLYALFKGKADFVVTCFKGRAIFAYAVFEGEADFGITTFEVGVHFMNASFNRQTNFAGASIKGEGYFLNATFQEMVSFCSAAFGDFIMITAEEHHKKAFRQEVDFRNVKLLKPEKVEFHKVDLNRFRFLQTDLRGVRFTDVDWYKEKEKGRNKVFDEVSPDPKTKKFDYALIAQLCRCLRANYEENLRYSEAGDFYIGEMEMTRKAEKNIFKKLPLLFYKAISNYGESYYRTLWWIAVILLIFPLLFMFTGIEPISLDSTNPMEEIIHYRLDFSSIESVQLTIEKIGDYYTCFLYSMSVFSFIRDKKYTTLDNWGHTLFVLESILGPVTLAFFLLALRRRFKR